MGQELTSTPDALRGTTMPSGTPYSLGAYLGGQAGNLFEQMVENKGLHLEDMMEKHIIPFAKTKLNNKDEIMAMLDDADIKKFDAIYLPNAAVESYNNKIKNEILNLGGVAEPFNKVKEEQEVSEGLASQGNIRPIKPELEGKDITWKEVFKDLEWNIEMGITNENSDKQALLTSLSSTLQTIASFAGRPMTSEERLVFNKIMKEAGVVSPIELSALTQAPQVPQQPVNIPQQAIEGLVK